MSLETALRLKDGRTALLRRARSEDAETHIENWNTVGSERVYLMAEEFGQSVEEIRGQLRDADSRSALWLVAEVDRRLVGGANFRRGSWSKNSHTAEVSVAVLKKFRSLGIGEGLVRVGIDWSRSVDIRKLKVEVFATNERALALCRKLGFAEEGRLKDDVVLEGRLVDVVLLSRSVGPPGPH